MDALSGLTLAAEPGVTFYCTEVFLPKMDTLGLGWPTRCVTILVDHS